MGEAVFIFFGPPVCHVFGRIIGQQARGQLNAWDTFFFVLVVIAGREGREEGKKK